MEKISIDSYKKEIKNERKKTFDQPYEFVYKKFIDLKFNTKKPSYFRENASNIIESLRKKCWDDFQPIEKEFTTKMLKSLINEERINELSPVDAVALFVEEYPTHIYELNLSNTQSRRSRAGKEFEAIIELTLIGAGVRLDTQSNIGKKEFINKGLGKMVDIVTPGVVEYILNKRNVVLISAKTSLRERWQEVPDELGRTGAREMFLATLDDNISQEVLDNLYEANIQVTTTKNIKEKSYKENNRVLTFEELIGICLDNVKRWKDFDYSLENKEALIEMLNKQIGKHKNHEFIKEYYNNILKDSEV